MAKTNVFNPHRGFDKDLGFNTNWNYGSPRKTGANYQTQRPRFGTWATRSVGNAGYSFDMTFVDRPIEFVHYVRSFYEQHQTGFFTLIDHDNGAREHVGRFTAYPQDVQTANGKYTINATFEDMPGCPMRKYPNDWAHSSHWIPIVDDFGNPLSGFSGSGSWGYQSLDGTFAGSLGSPSAALLANPNGFRITEYPSAGGDFAQIEYVGWGFRLSLPVGSSWCVCSLYVDDVELLVSVDLSAPSYIGASGLVITGGSAGIPYTIVKEDLPLGRHRVKLVATGQAGANSPSNTFTFPAVEVMH